MGAIIAFVIGQGFLVPKLCLGTVFTKLCFASRVRQPWGRRETEFRGQRSQTEFGNEKKWSRSSLLAMNRA